MSFKATITNPDSHNLWYRSMHVLSSINEDIRFTITSREVIAWSINTTDTTLSQIRFEKAFFEEFDFQPHKIVFGENGLQVVTSANNNVQHKLYSFKVNGRHMTTISRKSDGDTINSFTIAIDNTSTCPESLANRLTVLVNMDSLITKEYTPQFEPITYDPIIINVKYKRKFLEVYGSSTDTNDEQLDPKLLQVFESTERELSQVLFDDKSHATDSNKGPLTASDEMNYICCHQAVLRNFIDNCNTSVTEEIKLDINVSRLVMTAFTKAIYGKNNSLLKNAISMSNTISTSNLEHYCLFTTLGAEEDVDDETAGQQKRMHINDTKSIVFKLKDFKNFLSILSTNGSKSVYSNDVGIWFCHPGDPILIETKTNNIRLELVQVTDAKQVSQQSEDNNVTISPNRNGTELRTLESPKTHKIHTTNKNVLQKVDNLVSPSKKPSISKPLLKKPNMMADRLFIKEYEEENETTASTNEVSATVEETPVFYPPTIAERSTTTVGWGQKIIDGSDQTEPSATIDKQSVLKNEKMNHFKGLAREKEKDAEDDSEEKGLGPTQILPLKGLFD